MRDLAPNSWTINPVHRLTATELCELHVERVYRFASMVSKGAVDAEDLAQQALERAIRAIDSYDCSRGSIEGWLWQIVLNTARDAGRVEHRRQLILERMVALLPRPIPGDSPDLDSAVSDQELMEAIRGLRPRERALIALRYGADLDYAAVGASLGMSAEAAGVATRRAVNTLRSRLHIENRRGK